MRPVPLKYPTSQGFGSGATQGVDPNSSHPMAALVRLYGNYQPFGHAGEDIACPVGTPVHAMADGTVLWADWGTNLPGDESEWGYRQRWYLYKGFPGIVTVIQHPGWVGIYAHLSSNDAAPRGAKVKAGQLIGYSGDTGGVAPHLHREALVDLNYTTGGGLIYGRTNPTKYDGGTLTTQSSAVEPAPTEEFTVAEAAKIIAILTENQTRITAARDNAALAVRIATENQKRISETREIVKAIAAKTGTVIDYAKIEAAAKAGAAGALANGVDLDATVTVKKAV